MSIKNKIIIFCAVLCLAQANAWATAKKMFQNSLDITALTSASCSYGEHAPFWFTNNRHGLSTTNPNSIMARASLVGDMSWNNRFGIDYCADIAAAAGFEKSVYIHQLYADFSYKWLNLSIGSKERWGELKNPELSSGGMTWSGNCRPIPQIRLEVPDFAAFAGGWVALKGHIAVGTLTDSEYRRNVDYPRIATNVRFHSKAGFVRFGNSEKFPLNFIFGLEMYALYGGQVYNNQTGEKLQELQSGWAGLKTVLLPFNKTGEQGMNNGNTLGSWHFAFTWTQKDWNAKVYYEHFYEDHSSMLGIEYKNDMNGKKRFVTYGFKHDFADGLWGVELNGPKSWPVRTVVFEFLNTYNQCGALLNYPNPDLLEEVSGRDDFYAHGIYAAYTHCGYGIGNPLILSPVYNKDGSPKYISNRIHAYHIGVNGNAGDKVEWKVLADLTYSWGLYQAPFRNVVKNTMIMLEGAYSFGKNNSWKTIMDLGFDFDKSDYLGNNAGVMLSIVKRFNVL